jgi:hypothetical protein
VETDSNGPIVAIESRDIENRNTYYSAFNYQSGECLFKEISVENGWFWSLDRVHHERVLLHSYLHEGSPEHSGIIALDFNGAIAWQQFNKTLHEVHHDGLIVYNPKIQPKQYELVRADNALPITGKPDTDRIPQRAIILPDILPESALSQLPSSDNIVPPVLFKAYRSKVIMAFHSKHGDLFNQQLLVYDQGQLVLEENLAHGIQKLNPEAFFIERQHLFCIRNNKQEFVSYLV